jgi:integrase/recombinase XerD
MWQRHQGRPGSTAARGRPGHRPGRRYPNQRADLLNSRGARMDRHAATRRLRRLAQTAGVPITKPHPHMLRHAFVTTMLDAGVDLRDVQIAARHADPRTTMRYDRARKNLDRHPNYILAAYMASGT